ncbi:43917_t:CDS:2, partial [Gigaspora margarita]
AKKENSKINMKFAKIVKYNLIIEVKTKNHNISINGYLKLFDMNPAEFQLNYKYFEGEIKMKGSLLGIDNPIFKRYWSKMNKFFITESACFHILFWDTAKFAKIIEKVSRLEIAEIDIYSIQLDIKYPNDLLKYLLEYFEELPKNADEREMKKINKRVKDAVGRISNMVIQLQSWNFVFKKQMNIPKNVENDKLA